MARDGTVSRPATYLQRVLAARLLERDDGHVVHRAGQQHVILHDLGAKGTVVGSSCRVAGHDISGRGGARLRERWRLTGSLTACFGAAATAGPRVILNGARRTLPSGAAGAAAELAGGASRRREVVLYGGSAGAAVRTCGLQHASPALPHQAPGRSEQSTPQAAAHAAAGGRRRRGRCAAAWRGGQDLRGCAHLEAGDSVGDELGIVLEARGVGDAYRLIIAHGLVALVPIRHLRGAGTASFGGGQITTAGREAHVLYPQSAGQALPLVARAGTEPPC